MKIETDIKLDFKDVLIKPKRSQAPSRSKVDLFRTFKFLNSKRGWHGIPIIAANMDTIATFTMARTLAKASISTSLHKHYTLEKLEEFYATEMSGGVLDYVFYTVGITDSDIEKLFTLQKRLINKYGYSIDKITIDVANAYTEYFQSRSKTIRENFPEAVIMAGNVATPEMVTELLISGSADIIKVGIGGGCFTANTLVKMKKGYQKIKKVNIGDYVLTHLGRLQKVVNTSSRLENKSVMMINDNIRCTKNHEFYVLPKKHKDITDVHKKAQWISANELTTDYFLLSWKDENVYDRVEIKKVEEFVYDDIVYDLEVEEDHSYCVSEKNIVVHNSACTTRIKSAIGYPQLSAVSECADAAHGLNGHICSDGGCTCPGDVAKAFGAGADFCMLGGMLAGHAECDEAEWIYHPKVLTPPGKPHVATGELVKKSMLFYGMSSREAMEKYSGGVAEYKAAEGKCVEIPYRGVVMDTVNDILGGLRSCCTYVGTTKLKDLSKCTTFIRCNDTHNRVYE